MMPKKYEVAFVVYADIPEKDSSIGDLECNGTLRSYNCYSLRDARMYFTISAETPEEAYKKGLEKCSSVMLILEKRWWKTGTWRTFLAATNTGTRKTLHSDCFTCRFQIGLRYKRFFVKKED